MSEVIVSPCEKCGKDFYSYRTARQRFCSGICARKDPRSNEERFWSKVDKRGPDECWPWTAGKMASGYGSFRADRKTYNASRFAWESENGPAGDLFVCHRCDNPPCCNPIHLFAGTPSENVRDKCKKWRQTRGSQHKLAKISEGNIPVIRMLLALGATQRNIADWYGVCQQLISGLHAGRRWKHAVTGQPILRQSQSGD